MTLFLLENISRLIKQAVNFLLTQLILKVMVTNKSQKIGLN